ncbi:MAG: alcohol dehydrogenase, partial [Thermoprotei archaeon]
TEGRGVDKVIEATGSPKVLEQALRVIDYCGKILVFGVAPPEAKVNISPYIVYRKEVTIMGSFTNPFTTEDSVKLLSSGVVKVKPLVSHVIRLEDIVEYFNRIMRRDKDIIKVLVKPG